MPDNKYKILYKTDLVLPTMLKDYLLKSFTLSMFAISSTFNHLLSNISKTWLTIIWLQFSKTCRSPLPSTTNKDKLVIIFQGPQNLIPSYITTPSIPYALGNNYTSHYYLWGATKYWKEREDKQMFLGIWKRKKNMCQ